MSGRPNRDPNAPDIRAWGKENGWEVEDGGRIPAALRSAWATATGGGTAANGSQAAANGHRPETVTDLLEQGGTVTFSVPDFIPGIDDPGSQAAEAEERAPVEPPRRSRREQLVERFRRPAGKRRRVTLETLGGLVWAGAAQLCARNGRFVPVATIMAFQAPVAGMVAEDVLKHTVADTVLQPIARVVESGGAAGALLGPPALVGIVCARPELYPVARPMLAACMKEWITVAGPKLRELQRREEKFQAEMAQLGEEFDIDIDTMLDQVFAPLFAQGQPGPDAMRSTPDDADQAAKAG